GIKKGRVLVERMAVNHALGEVTALERRDLRGEKAERAALGPVGVVDTEHVVLQPELDRRLPRDLHAGRRGPAARHDEGHQDRERQRRREDRQHETEMTLKDREIIAQVTRTLFAEVPVEGGRNASPPGRGRYVARNDVDLVHVALLPTG